MRFLICGQACPERLAASKLPGSLIKRKGKSAQFLDPAHTLSKIAGAPPSSSGLGRRPLTAETGVQVP